MTVLTPLASLLAALTVQTPSPAASFPATAEKSESGAEAEPGAVDPKRAFPALLVRLVEESEDGEDKPATRVLSVAVPLPVASEPSPDLPQVNLPDGPHPAPSEPQLIAPAPESAAPTEPQLQPDAAPSPTPAIPASQPKPAASIATQPAEKTESPARPIAMVRAGRTPPAAESGAVSEPEQPAIAEPAQIGQDGSAKPLSKPALSPRSVSAKPAPLAPFADSKAMLTAMDAPQASAPPPIAQPADVLPPSTPPITDDVTVEPAQANPPFVWAPAEPAPIANAPATAKPGPPRRSWSAAVQPPAASSAPIPADQPLAPVAAPLPSTHPAESAQESPLAPPPATRSAPPPAPAIPTTIEHSAGPRPAPMEPLAFEMRLVPVHPPDHAVIREETKAIVADSLAPAAPEAPPSPKAVVVEPVSAAVADQPDQRSPDRQPPDRKDSPAGAEPVRLRKPEPPTAAAPDALMQGQTRIAVRATVAVAETLQPTTAPARSASLQHQLSRTELPAPPPAVRQPAAARSIQLAVDSGDRRVEVRLVERAGEVHVDVRTPDSKLAADLGADLPALSSRLENTGFRAEAWRPGSMDAAERTRPEVPAGTAAQTGGDRPPQDRGGRQSDGREPPPKPAEDQRKQAPRKDFEWLLSTLR